MINQCVICGKFHKFEDLIYQRTDDTECTQYDEWFECRRCASKYNEKTYFKLKDPPK